MALIRERLEELKEKYTYEEIAFVYNELRHNMSLGRGISMQVEKSDSITLVEFIAKKLAEKYSGNEELFYAFKNPANSVYIMFSNGPANISLDDFLNNVPVDIDTECVNIVETLK